MIIDDLAGTSEQWRSARDRVAKLSRRELEVLYYVAQGFSNKEIAQRWGISFRTIEIHRGNVLAKLQARTMSDAVRIAVQASLFKSDLTDSA